ncbi:hypothetical protein F5Y15DRAFT_425161 [Xylariaceae sp. FL0016]|nr:hypothetical protein F5Y15DRAFT_425161 [Xylariaceae sp. FL0016]
MPTTKLTFDVLCEIAKHTRPHDKVILAAVDRDLHSVLGEHAFREVIMNEVAVVANRPLIYAIKHGDIAMLSKIHDITKLTKYALEVPFRWGLRFETMLRLAFHSSTSSLQLLLETFPASTFTRSHVSFNSHSRACITVLLERAVKRGRRDLIDVILPVVLPLRQGEAHYHIDDFLGYVWRSAPNNEMRSYIFQKGCRATTSSLCEAIDENEFPDPELLQLLLRNGIELEGNPWWNPDHTLLAAACCQADPHAVKELVRLGANLNGVSREGIDRPIDILIWETQSNRPSNTLRCLQTLFEHGASADRAKGVVDPVHQLLIEVWSIFWLKARIAASYHSGHRTENTNKVLDAMSSMNIYPFDKICDLFVERRADWAAKAPRTEGKERLLNLLRYVSRALPHLNKHGGLITRPWDFSMPKEDWEYHGNQGSTGSQYDYENSNDAKFFRDFKRRG